MTLESKYNITGIFYDILDYPWERQYKKWRSSFVSDVKGIVLEAGVGTGRNLKHYNQDVQLTAIDLSKIMLSKAAKRKKHAKCNVNLFHEDASVMKNIEDNKYDWVVSSFLCCVMPDTLQPKAIEQFGRILKNNGKFRLLEIVYSKDKKLKRRQKLFSRFVEKVYGARFYRNTLEYIKNSSKLKITNTYFLKDDTYLVIEGVCRK